MLSTFIPLAALALLLALAAYLTTAAVGQALAALKANRLFEAERELLATRVQRLMDRIAAVDSQAGQPAWSGYRKFVVQGKVLEGEDICSFYLVPHDGHPLPPFLPGQYLTFQVAPPGTDRPVVRCYSLSDSPTNPDYYRVTIKRIRARPEVEGSHDGLVSSWFHHHLQPDDLLDVKAPTGHFHLDPESPTPLVLTGGGIGVTPVLSMLSYIAATGSKRETWFFYGVRHGGEHIMKDYLRSLAEEHDNIHIRICYSHPRPQDVLGVDYDHAERVTVDLFRRLLPASNYEFYTCGPAPMMDQITRELEEWGVPRSHIHYEAFGAATVRQVHRPVGVGEEGVEVQFARSGKSLVWDGQAGSLLELAEGAGIVIDSGCRAGNCGSCLTAIRSGTVEYLNEPGAPVEEGSCLPCIAVPRPGLVLDA